MTKINEKENEKPKIYLVEVIEIFEKKKDAEKYIQNHGEEGKTFVRGKILKTNQKVHLGV